LGTIEFFFKDQSPKEQIKRASPQHGRKILVEDCLSGGWKQSSALQRSIAESVTPPCERNPAVLFCARWERPQRVDSGRLIADRPGAKCPVLTFS